tara:strand:+ start:22367 stop:22825 length:459 start_codon:yes stop_codon:yes gene_type:complete
MKETIRGLIVEVLERLDDAGIPYSKEAMELVFETGNAETGYRHLEQMGNGPAKSFWQIEINTINDNWENYISYRKPLIEQLYKLGYIEDDPVFSVTSNIAVAIAMCRIYYYRQPGAIPKTPEGRANYWKKFFNTEGGKGTPKHYLEANKLWI